MVRTQRSGFARGSRPSALVLAFVLLQLLLAPVTAPAQNPTTLSFGIVPQQSASKLVRLWTPIMRYLSEKSGARLRFRTAPSIPEFETRLARGEYDIAYMNPYHYTVFHKRSGYQAFAKQSNKRIEGIIVVRKDSPVESVFELKNSTLAFPSPAAFAASLLPRAYMKKQDIPFLPKYVSSHDSVYRSVAAGFYPAGGGIVRTLNNLEPAIKADLKVLWTTRHYTPHAFAALSNVDPEVIRAIQQAMGEMKDDPQGARLLQTIHFEGIETAVNTDWDDVRQLNLHLLDPIGPLK